MQSLDSIIEVLNAAKEGKSIEYTSRFSDSEWKPVISPSEWEYDFINFTYRIKPTRKFRPYKDAEEFTEALSKHTTIRYRVDNNYYYPVAYNDSSITICYMDDITTHYEKIAYDVLKDYYEWDNDDICGILIEE